MSLKDDMLSDVVDVFLDIEEHADSITARDGEGQLRTITAIINRRGEDVVNIDQRGTRYRVREAQLHFASSLAVTENWTFDLDGDGTFWNVRQELGGIRDDSEGMSRCTVYRRDPVERGMPGYRMPG